MRKLLRLLLSAALAVILAVGMCACSSGSSGAKPVDEDKKNELAQQFMAELRDQLLPVREDAARLAALGVYVSREEEVGDVDAVYAFFAGVEANEDCALTVAFLTRSFVAARIEFIDGAGYYFRYQHDDKNPIEVSFKQIDNNLIFLPAFAVTETADGSTFYILKSIAMQENSIVIGRQYQFSATGQITDPQPEVSGPVYMEGIFGFKADKSGSCRRIEKACLKRINCYDKVLFNIHFDPKKYEVLLYPQMPPRYQADPFFEKVGQISQIIMPKSVGVFIPMSSKVKMKVRKL